MAVLLKDLMKAARQMSDLEIKRDLKDCVAVLAATEEEAEQIIQYGNLREKSPYFSPGKPGHNNHEFIKDHVQKSDRAPRKQPDGLCPESEQASGRGACRAKCDRCGRGTYVRKDGTWARHTPLKGR